MHWLRRTIRSVTDRRSWTEVLAEARDWLDQSAHEQGTNEALTDWLLASPRNLRAFLEESEERGLYDPSKDYPAPVPAPTATVHVLPLPKRLAIAPRSRRKWPIALAGAGAVIVAVVATHLVEEHIFPATPATQLRHSTSAGAPGAMPLPDGSTIELSARTAASAKIDSSERLVELEAGAGVFHVVQDPKRPFDVRASCGTVRTNGARFVLSRRSNGVCDVAVLEGELQVAQASDRPDPDSHRFRAVVKAGEHGYFSNLLLTVRAPDFPAVRRREMWIRGTLLLQGDPLDEVVEVYNRFNREQLVVLDPAAARLPLGGRMRADDATTFALALERIGAHIVRKRNPDRAEITLAPASPRPI